MDYGADLLAITGGAPGTDMPAGSTAEVNTSTPGRTVVSLASPTDLPGGPNQLVNLQANVPTANTAAIYGEQHVLDIHTIALTNAAGDALPSIDNDGLHVAAFFSDVSRNGRVNATDALQIARIATSLDTAFEKFVTTDFLILADVNENGQLNLNDAVDTARFAVSLPVDTIPPIPEGVVIAVGKGGPGTPFGLAPPKLILASPTEPRGYDTSDKVGVGASSTSGTNDAATSVYRPAVDTRTTSPTDRAMEEIDDNELPVTLEDAVASLLLT